MEPYYKETTLKEIVELFVLIKLESCQYDYMFESSYLEQFIGGRFSLRVRLEMLDFYNQINEREKEGDAKARLNKISFLLENVSEELTQKQKVELYVGLIDFVVDSSVIESGEDRLKVQAIHSLIVDKFNLSKEELWTIFLFVNNDIENKDLAQNLLIVGDFGNLKLRAFRTYQKEDVEGKIYLLYVESISSFLFRYVGTGEFSLNKQIVFPKRVYQFSTGGVLEAKKVKPLFFGDVYSYYFNSNSEILKLDVCGVSKVYKGTGMGIKELSFTAKSRQLCAIMGGSGTGKTTLMNILCGLEKPDKGQVLINDIDIQDNSFFYKQYVGYVPQDDLLIEELTVYQNLKYALLLSYRHLKEEEIAQRIDSRLKDLGIEKIKDLKVGSSLNKIISGGQRKRLNIALELIRNPDILFVDEPTSGLSSSDAYLVVKLLKEIANSGSIVIINIHQPQSDIFLLFDSLLILDENGYPAYFGNPFTASNYFKKHLEFVDSINDDNIKHGNCNPEQIINLMEYKKKSKEGVDSSERVFNNKDWHKVYIDDQAISKEASSNVQLQELIGNKINIPTVFKQFWVYFRRNVRVRSSDVQYLFLVLGGAPILAFAMSFFLKSTDIVTHEYSFIDNENITVYLFISVVVALFLGLIISSGEIFRDLKILKRESFLNLSSFSYLSSKAIYLAIINAIQIFLYVLIGNAVLEIKGLFLEYWFILWLTAFSSSMMGLFISSRFKSMLSVYITIPFLLIPQILLAGAILDYDKIHHSLTSKRYVPFYADLNISRWAFESLAVIQFTQNKYDKDLLDDYILKSKMTYHSNFFIVKAETILEQLNRTGDEKLRDEVHLLMNELIREYPEIEPEISAILKKKDNIQELSNVLKKIKKWLRKNINQVNKKIDDYRKGMSEDVTKLEYRNVKLTDMALKSNKYKKYVYQNGEMIRKFQPGYFVNNNRIGRSHYYAPYKYMGKYRLDTWKLNSLVIALIGLFFYLLTWLTLKAKTHQ